jgi:acetoin utilization deacetylase AcuC-like enzyme
MCDNKSQNEWCYVNQVVGDTTYVSPYTDIVIKRMSNMIKMAIDKQIVLSERFTFCLTRPPGHHACSNHIAGFCHKNFAIEALDYFTNQYQKKCIILDIDAHYGDGTVAELEKREYGSYISLHGYGPNVYPGTGDYMKNKRVCSLPLIKDATGDMWIDKFKTEAMPYIIESKAEIIILSAGFDGHQEDKIAPLALDTKTYHILGEYLRGLSIPVFSVLEGGYELPVLGKSAAALIYGFNGDFKKSSE